MTTEDVHVTAGMLEAAAEGRLNEQEVLGPDRTPADEAMEQWRTGSDLVQRPERLPEADAWQRMVEMARYLVRSPLMPKHIRESRDPEADAVVILLGAHDLGLSATVAFQKLIVIEGKLSMAAELMRMLVRRDGHEMWVEIERDELGRAQAAVAYGIRAEHSERVTETNAVGEVVVQANVGRQHEARFSVEDAIAAGLCRLDDDGNLRARKNDKVLPWEKYTEDMLVARATSRLCRRVFEDCLAGVSYTPEELGVIEVEADPSDSYVACSQAVLDRLLETIAALPEDGQAMVRDRWKAAKLRALRPTANNPQTLSTEELPVALMLLGEVARDTPQEAEIVTVHAFEGADGAAECATCGQDVDAPIHNVPEAVDRAVEDAAGVVGHSKVDEAVAQIVEGQAAEPVAVRPLFEFSIEWVENLAVTKVREALLQSQQPITGDNATLRRRLVTFVEDVRTGRVKDPRRCTTCGGYPWNAPPGFETCACPI